uniref:Uncharacterized protein n=1 Tax=Takifugu rubripes TaxID=31033 RepID=A0A3B5KG43_TAKRU
RALVLFLVGHSMICKKTPLEAPGGSVLQTLIVGKNRQETNISCRITSKERLMSQLRQANITLSDCHGQTTTVERAPNCKNMSCQREK